MARRARLDAELVRRGLARSRAQAAELIEAGQVAVHGQAAAKPATQVGQDAAITVQRADSGPGYVSRGGHKLAGALAAFTELRVSGRRCLDAGVDLRDQTELPIAPMHLPDTEGDKHREGDGGQRGEPNRLGRAETAAAIAPGVRPAGRLAA